MTVPMDVRFSVEGIPVPKGNMSGFPVDRGPCRACKPGKPCRARNCFVGRAMGVSVTDQGGKELEAWQELTFVRAVSARNAAGMRVIARPNACEVVLVFVMPRPDGHWTPAGALTAAGRERLLPTVKPDVDKMTRAILDGITTALLEDDALVVVARVAEVYAGWKGWTGACVRARQISSMDAWVEHELAYHGVWSPPTQRALL